MMTSDHNGKPMQPQPPQTRPGAAPPPHITRPRPPLLSVQHLYKYYRDLLAVNDVSLAVQPGEIVGLVGPNGAGKTTILRCISGVLRFDAGRITCGDVDVTTDPQTAKYLISLVPEVPNLYQLLTTIEHLRFFHMAFGEQDKFAVRADALLQRLDLTEQRDDLVSTLSKGMRQKLAVACAFIHSSRIFLFDEPFIGIDPAGQKAVRELIYESAHNGASILISSHVLETVEHLCHRILVLDRGRLIARGDVAQLRKRAKMEEDTPFEDVFLRLTQGSGDG